MKREIPEGSCDIGVLDSGQVVIQFSELIKQMTFTPQQAKALGMGLIEMGTRGESLQRVQPPDKTLTTMSRVKH